MYAVLTPATACRALREAGFPHPAEALHIDAREATCDRTTGVVLRGTESLLTRRWRETDSKFQYRAKSTTPCVIRDEHDRLSAVRSEQPQSLPSVRLSGKKCGSAAWARATNSATAPCDGNIPQYSSKLSILPSRHCRSTRTS